MAVLASDDVRRWTLGGWDAALLVGPDLVLFVGGSAVTAAVGSKAWAAIVAAWTTVVTVALAGYAVATRDAGWGAALMVVAALGTWAATLTIRLGRLPVHWFFVGPFSFRPADDRSPRAHLRRSLTQLVVFWTALLVLLPLGLAWFERRLRLSWPPLEATGWTAAGAAIFAVASAAALWSCLSMALVGHGTPLPAATARELVVVGPYRVVRNPMALCGALQTVGAGLVLGSWIVVASAVAGAVLWDTFIRPAEEADLADRFGASYEAYRRRVRCWVPRPREVRT